MWLIRTPMCAKFSVCAKIVVTLAPKKIIRIIYRLISKKKKIKENKNEIITKKKLKLKISDISN